MHKDSPTENEVIDYDFFGKKLYPPKKMRVTDAGKEFAALFREIDRMCRPSKESRKTDFTHFSRRGPKPQMQPCVVKMYYTEDKAAHINFLRNYMPQKNKKEVSEKPVLFNDRFDAVPEDQVLEYERIADDLGFKFIISPESQSVDMRCLVRQFVLDLEKITGHRFSWMAATHTDTGHIHTHLLINGVDKRTGEKIRFDPSIVRTVARNNASRICTELVGSRSAEAIELSRTNLPNAKRWTKIDEGIVSSWGYEPFPVARIVSGCEFESAKVACDDTEIRRLNNLVSMGLAIVYKKKSPPRYFLEKGWKEKLKAIGRYNTYLDARQKLEYTAPQNLELYGGEMGKIEGVVTQVYNMDDEYVWNNAVVIENKSLGRAWYVPSRIKMNADDIGKFITVSAEKNAKGKVRPVIVVHSN